MTLWSGDYEKIFDEHMTPKVDTILSLPTTNKENALHI